MTDTMAMTWLMTRAVTEEQAVDTPTLASAKAEQHAADDATDRMDADDVEAVVVAGHFVLSWMAGSSRRGDDAKTIGASPPTNPAGVMATRPATTRRPHRASWRDHALPFDASQATMPAAPPRTVEHGLCGDTVAAKAEPPMKPNIRTWMPAPSMTKGQVVGRHGLVRPAALPRTMTRATTATGINVNRRATGEVDGGGSSLLWCQPT